jgi:hypothetical protein
VIEAPHRLVCRQVMSVSNGSSVETRVTVTFEERDGQTLLALLEAGIRPRRSATNSSGVGPTSSMRTSDRSCRSG